jgi:Fe-S cluster biosynthesis and repair protein YggX
MRMVQCVKIGKEAEGLDRPPFPNALGKRIFENVSKDGWKLWLAHSTMLINEYRLDLSSKQGTEMLLKQCEEFFFGDGGAKPEGYVPEAPKAPDGDKA